MPLKDDASLLAAVARDRDRRAFESLYDRHHRLVYGLACRMLGDPGDAEELLQLVFMHLWERAGSYDQGRGSAAAWLAVMTRSRCLDRLRKRKRGRFREMSVEESMLEALAGPAPAGPDPRLARALAEGLQKLPSEQQAAVEAVYFQGLTQSEAAQALRLPLGTVKGRLRLAMDKLALALGPWRSES
jgi:RNA polymerase sigma-70 factor (ECF subfamily)